ncbi:MAG: hypothetical protein J6S83_06865 [Lachnospiraceae bacterium]|nr:hypothetical protein [Lachnospiraceae bacterium]
MNTQVTKTIQKEPAVLSAPAALLRGVLFAAILLAILVAAGFFTRPAGIDGSVARVKAFHALSPDSVEVMVYGSSRAMRSVDPAVMYEAYGIGAYNYGGNWQKINTTNMFLHDSLRTQSPKVALVEVKNVHRLTQDSELTGELYYTREVPFSLNKMAYLIQCFREKTERYISYLLPVFATHENWPQAFSRKKSSSTVSRVLANYGYAPTNSVREITFGNTNQNKALSEQSVRVLDSIVEACRKEGTEVVFYVAPSSNNYAYAKAMTEYADSHGCVFFDGYMRKNEIGIIPTTDYKDLYHLNSSGARKFSLYLGQFLKERYDLTDLRGADGTLWEEELSEVGT